MESTYVYFARKSLIVALAAGLTLSVAAATVRRGDLVFTATIADLPADVGPVTVWVPIPSSNRDQEVTNLSIEGTERWVLGSEDTYGNRYVHATIEHPPATIQATVHLHIERRTVLFDKLRPADVPQEELRRHLLANRLVTLSPRVRAIADKVTKNTRGILDEARALYDWVAANVAFDRSTPGWGQGDTERAIELKAGDCTDFESLFISLARARGIPARFVIGMPFPEPGKPVTDYECWAEFYLQARGWVPVDPAGASRTTDPGVQNFMFGNLGFDRVQFSAGRDIVIDPPTRAPLNYFVFPHAEAAGAAVGTPSISLELATDPSKAPRRRR